MLLSDTALASSTTKRTYKYQLLRTFITTRFLYFRIFSCLLAVCIVCIAVCIAGLMWSSRPLTDCRLEESGVWTDIPESHVELVLANDVTSLISYSMVVQASKPQMPGSSFLGEYLHNGGSKDFLQVRLVVYLAPGTINRHQVPGTLAGVRAKQSNSSTAALLIL